MPADDRLVLRPVRLVIMTNWDAGFQLTPDAEPLPDVLPGDEYVIECVPQQHVLIREALVRDYALVQVSVDSQTVMAPMVTRGALPRLYRLPVAITAHADACVAVRLRNDGPVTLKRKVPTFVREDASAARIDPAPTGRAEDAVPCPACGKEAGASCDGPASHPSRLMLHIERTVAKSHQATVEVVEDRHVGNVGGSSAGSSTRDPSSRCLACDSPVRGDRRQMFGASGTRPYCKDAWHDGPITHSPQIARTTAEGPGNASLVRGCSCGAEIRTTAAFAEHVGVPEDAMRALLALAGIAFDLIDHPKAMRSDARRQIARCLEFAR